MATLPNVVLVHGAWGNASHWNKVILPLQRKGYKVTAVENPLTSLEDDAERTRKLIAAQDGPVVLVGHSYGGAVITQAGNEPNVKALVYIAAFAPDEGDSLGSIFAQREPPSGAASIRRDKDGFLWLDRDQFHQSFSQDLSDDEAELMAATQKPIAGRCFEDKSGVPAWKTKPSWYQVSEQDHMIPPATEHWMAERIAPRKIVSLPASHASLASHPDVVVALIEEAADSVH